MAEIKENLKVRNADMAELTLALEQGRKGRPFRSLLFILWGLIIAKCFIAEWAVLKYNAPINEFIFVWMPTLIFGALCTLVYASLRVKEFYKRALTGQFVHHIWLSTLMGTAITGLGGLMWHQYNPFLLPAFIAVFLGSGFFIHSVINRRQIYKIAAIGWWIGAVYLFHKPDLDALAWFSLMLVVFQVIPCTVVYFIERFADRTNG